MTRRRGIVLSLAMGVLALAPFARAQVIEHPEVQIIVPQRRVIAPPSVTPVTLSAVNVDVEIADRVATTTVRIDLSNSTGSIREAQVVLPVPDGAVVRSFALEGMGEAGEAKIMPRDEARRIYEDIVRRMRDPGLLEFEGYGLIRSSVFPVPANGTQTARIVYEQVLGYDAGRLDYELPRSAVEGPEWTINLKIRSTEPIATVYSPTHELEKTDCPETCYRVKGADAPGSFHLSLVLEDRDGVNATLVACPDTDDGGGYFLFLAGVPTPDEHSVVKREVVLVLDRSGSMRGEKIEQAREAALQVLAGLKDGERFNIIDYSDTIESFADEPVAKDAETTAQAEKYLAAITANGGTNIHDALVEAARQNTADDFLPMVLFLTDGLPTIGPRDEPTILNALAKQNTAHRRVFTFGVGYDVNSPLLVEVAQGTRGTATFVKPEEDVEVKVGQVFRRLSGPVLAAPTLTARGDDGEPVRGLIRDVLPSALPDVFEGDQLVVLGRYTEEGTLNLVLEGEYLGKHRAFDYTFDLSKASLRNSHVARMWAGRKIASLIREIRSAGGSDADSELVDEIVRLSVKYGILTEYTAFLATEPDFVSRRQLSAGTPAARAPADAALRREAAGVRVGRGAVRQDLSLNEMEKGKAGGIANNDYFFNDEMQAEGRLRNVQQIAQGAVFNRAGRWIDSRLADNDAEPDEEIEFGTDRYFELARQLASEGRQALLAVRGDVELLVQGRRVLVRGPGS